jgi:hypothetical protein
MTILSAPSTAAIQLYRQHSYRKTNDQQNDGRHLAKLLKAAAVDPSRYVLDADSHCPYWQLNDCLSKHPRL